MRLHHQQLPSRHLCHRRNAVVQRLPRGKVQRRRRHQLHPLRAQLFQRKGRALLRPCVPRRLWLVGAELHLVPKCAFSLTHSHAVN